VNADPKPHAAAPFSATQAAAWTSGDVIRGPADATFAGVSIDSREIPTGGLFVAIVGERHDAHGFVETAVESGATGVLALRDRELPDLGPSVTVVAVDDTTASLGALAAGHRSLYAGPLVAVTGSNGKTTTKEMCAAILSQRAPCLKNRGNLNNQFGLPLTLLRRSSNHRTVIVEIGMNHRGEIAPLVAIAQPTVGLIMNVGNAHIEHLGSVDEIALEKGDLVAPLPASATAVLNADDERVARQAQRTVARLVRFGRSADADIRGEEFRQADDGCVHFAIACDAGRCDVSVAGLGESAMSNGLGAAAAAMAAGASLDDVVSGLASYRPVSGRLTRIDLPGDVVVIDDTYNANPQSMENALRALATLPGRTRRIAVLGDMGELGDSTASAHVAAGRLAAELGLDYVVAVGAQAERIAAGAFEAGMPAARALPCDRFETACERVSELLRGGDGVLVKGSRSARMERVVEALVKGKSD